MSRYSEIYILNTYVAVKITIFLPFILISKIENLVLFINSGYIN